jgi:hypothetical protein
MAHDRSLPKLIDYLAGRWSKTRPQQPGVYLVREGGNAWVLYWQPDAVSPFGEADPSAEREFFLLRGDADGSPTRWDDPRVVEQAKAGGWRGE